MVRQACALNSLHDFCPAPLARPRSLHRQPTAEQTDNPLSSTHVRGTEVTDAGLKELKGLKALTRLEVGNTKVTDEGVKDLQKALPGCRVIR